MGQKFKQSKMSKKMLKATLPMQLSVKQTKKLLKGNHSFSQVNFGMLLTRLKLRYLNDMSKDTLKLCMNEINTFIRVFGGKMESDINILRSL